MLISQPDGFSSQPQRVKLSREISDNHFSDMHQGVRLKRRTSYPGGA